MVATVILSAGALAQSAPPPCPADRPVDDIIAEVNKKQSKKNHRNSNPFPEVTCIFGWCRNHSRTPPTFPEPAPKAETPKSSQDTSSSSISSSRTAVDCDEAMERALRAAQDVDVGDYYFGEKNYKAAMLRYKDANEAKPDDIAIHVRLGRAFEKLDQLPQATEEYEAAQKLSGPKRWSDEAGAALMRLRKGPPS